MADGGTADDEAAGHTKLWTRANSEYADAHADRARAAEDITRGIVTVPEQQAGVLGDVRGLQAAEPGCGTAYFPARLARPDARPCDPARWVPEAARLLRDGGRLVFCTVSVLVTLCSPRPSGPARRDLVRSQRAVHRLVSAQGGVQFHPSHGEWIEILRASGFVIDALHELCAPPEAPGHPYYTVATADRARHWPVEEIWAAHLVH